MSDAQPNWKLCCNFNVILIYLASVFSLIGDKSGEKITRFEFKQIKTQKKNTHKHMHSPRSINCVVVDCNCSAGSVSFGITLYVCVCLNWRVQRYISFTWLVENNGMEVEMMARKTLGFGLWLKIALCRQLPFDALIATVASLAEVVRSNAISRDGFAKRAKVWNGKFPFRPGENMRERDETVTRLQFYCIRWHVQWNFNSWKIIQNRIDETNRIPSQANRHRWN